MSRLGDLSPPARLVAVDEKTTDLPERAICAPSLSPFAALPLLARDARNVSPLKPASRPVPPSTWTYACFVPGFTAEVFAVAHAALPPLVRARLLASEVNATRSQSPLIEMS